MSALASGDKRAELTELQQLEDASAELVRTLQALNSSFVALESGSQANVNIMQRWADVFELMRTAENERVLLTLPREVAQKSE